MVLNQEFENIQSISSIRHQCPKMIFKKLGDCFNVTLSNFFFILYSDFRKISVRQSADNATPHNPKIIKKSRKNKFPPKWRVTCQGMDVNFGVRIYDQSENDEIQNNLEKSSKIGQAMAILVVLLVLKNIQPIS